MKISYHWLSEYLPAGPAGIRDKLNPEVLSGILTSIGLEVETMGKYEEVKGSFEGLIIGEVLEVNPHPNAEKLKVTQVNIGREAPLKIVCGAPNVAVGQKVVVAAIGATIYPVKGEPLKMKSARIRGEESEGMICAEDEIGLGESHDGIMVLNRDAEAGMSVREYFQPVEDRIYEIGLTPNRMDAMSHLGVARDVCAWLSNKEEKAVHPVIQPVDNFKADNHNRQFSIEVKNSAACPRYTGVSLTDIKVAESPTWLRQKLKAIGVRPINNVVDITNFVLNECGQPLHAFDGDKIAGNKIIVQNLPEGTPFITLDGQECKLHAEDLMICDARGGMCIAGVFGGRNSGVTDKTTNIFLESACFSAVTTRRTSFRHDLRTDAAMRFEKGVDISGVIYALKRAACLMMELCGAKISSHITDIYPEPRPQTRIKFSYEYLTRLSGKQYRSEQVKNILRSLGFEILRQHEDELEIAVPYSKPDISLPADLAEEVMRIDGYDNIAIPSHINISTAHGQRPNSETLRAKVSGYLTANGFYEIFTNSITNSHYYDEDQPLIHLMNNLSAALDVMRPSLLETGLEAVAYNLNRKQQDVLFFEFGKTYLPGDGHYDEKEYLALYLSGNKSPENWLRKSVAVDNYFLKGHLHNIFSVLGLTTPEIIAEEYPRIQMAQKIILNDNKVGTFGKISTSMQQRFGIKQQVWYAEIDWDLLTELNRSSTVKYQETPRFPYIRRDLALILDKNIPFAMVEKTARTAKSKILQQTNLFDVFESEKLGTEKKSYAVSFIFRHGEKTLTDKEVDKDMQKLTNAFESELQAEIRK